MPSTSPFLAVPDWIKAKAYAIPKETTNQGSGYFSIVTGKNGKLRPTSGAWTAGAIEV